MKRILIIITFFVLLPKIYSQDTITQLNYHIFIDGRLVMTGINGVFLINDTINNNSFSFPFRYDAGSIEIETKDYEKINHFNKPIIIMNFEKNVRSEGIYTTYHNYNIKIPYKFFSNKIRIKIYNRESKKYRKYWKQKENYVVDINFSNGVSISQARGWKSKKRMEQFRKYECDNG